MAGKMKKFSSTLGATLHESLNTVNDIDPKVTVKKRSQHSLAATAGKRKQVAVISVDPNRCKLWELQNMDQRYLTRENCGDVIESIRLHGQREPALARELIGDPDYDFELIYGSRRRFACLQLGRDLDIVLTSANDKACVVLMDLENRARKDISDYERALDYKRWLEKGLYKNQKELAEQIGVDPGNLNRLLKLAELPEPIVKAFRSPLEIRTHYATELLKGLSKPSTQSHMLRVASELKNKPATGPVVFRKLTTKPQKIERTQDQTIEKNGQTILKYAVNKSQLKIQADISVSKDCLEGALQELMSTVYKP